MMGNFEAFGQLKPGYNQLTDINGKHADMLVDMGVHVIVPGETVRFTENDKEIALLLLVGSICLSWQDKTVYVKRNSFFDENPACLHVPRNVEVEVTADEQTELLVIKVLNENDFNPKWYSPDDTILQIFGEGVWNGAARRMVRTVFDYNSAPWSNIVVGEVISFPGRWSSYIPHHHPQPEVYYYRFDKPQGFGCSIIGDEVYRITNNSISAIPGGLVHPQVTAPGYAMYYCWVIRHLPGNPWTTREDDEQHKWLLEPNAVIWPDKE